MGLLSRFVEPDVDRHLITSEGEYVIDEVAKHWVTMVGPGLAIVATMPFFWTIPSWGRLWWVPMVAGLAVICWAILRIHIYYMDRFVITNMRVFRVHGVLDQHLATMPMTRILDISVVQPFWGRLLGYGHFVFESAAQDQGLRDIRYVGRPEQRDLTIQQVIQRAGLRANVRIRDEQDDGS